LRISDPQGTMFEARQHSLREARMPRLRLVLLLVLIPLAPLSLGDEPEKSKPAPAKPDDVKSIDAIVAAVYDVISGPAGQKRDWNRFRSLFAPGARLIPIVSRPNDATEARVLDVEAFVKIADESSQRAGFYEKEISRKTDSFGRMAHVFSTYESRRSPDQPPFVRGINSMHLQKDGDRWWVVTIFWDSENPERPIPSRYLP
jgi:hypothetical protein